LSGRVVAHQHNSRFQYQSGDWLLPGLQQKQNIEDASAAIKAMLFWLSSRRLRFPTEPRFRNSLLSDNSFKKYRCRLIITTFESS
jgi:hypothetical protein